MKKLIMNEDKKENNLEDDDDKTNLKEVNDQENDQLDNAKNWRKK